MHFGHPWVLLAFWALPLYLLLLWLLQRRAQQRMAKLVDEPLRPRVFPQKGGWRFPVQMTALTLALAAGLLAAAAPRWGYRDEKIFQRGRDLIIALDVSRSMLARDVHPSRLQRARADIMDLLRVLEGDRVGLLVFRSRPILLCPLTTDYGFLESVLAEVSIDSAPPGATDLALAIEMACAAFDESSGAHRAVILITDGEDLAGRAAEAAQAAARAGVTIFTVGLGDTAGAAIPDEKTPGGFLLYNGETIKTRLDHAVLKKIAETTGGAYVPVGVANVRLDVLYRNHLRAIAAREREEISRRRLVERYQWFLLPAILAALLTAGLSCGRPATGQPRRFFAWRRGSLLLFAWFAFAGIPPGDITAEQTNNTVAAAPTNTAAISSAAAAAQAWRLYQAGEYRAAAALWQNAAAQLQTLNPSAAGASAAAAQQRTDLLFNAACAFYRAGDYQAAAKLFAEVARNSTDMNRAAAYNEGCAWRQTGALSNAAVFATSNLAAQVECLGKAAAAFLRAVHNAPQDDAAAGAALEEVAGILPSARRQLELQQLYERYQGLTPDKVTDELWKLQRAIMAESAAASTNAPPARIDKMDKLSRRQQEAADLAGLLSSALAASGQSSGGATSNLPPQLQNYFQSLQEAMEKTRQALRDAVPEAPAMAASTAAGVYNFWKSMAAFPALLHESIIRQSNAWLQAQETAGAAPHAAAVRADQAETRSLTELFLERFTNAVPAAEQPAAADTNLVAGVDAPLIDEAKRTNIIALAQEAMASQDRALEAINDQAWPACRSAQQNSLDLLLAIAKLLAPPPQAQPDNQEQQNQSEQEEKQEDKQKQNNQSQENQASSAAEQQNQPQPQQKNEQSQPQPSESDRQAAEQPGAQAQPTETGQEGKAAQLAEGEKAAAMTPEQAQRLIDRAAEREKEYRLQQQRFYKPLSPTDRDW